MNKVFIRALIQQHTRLTRSHLTPEICLHLITPGCHLWKSNIDNCLFDDPFWAFYWPGGQVLTRYILDNPGLFQFKSVLDVGSGCGSAAIAAKLVGASKVVANDIDPGTLKKQLHLWQLK
uniref:ETFB lysine methyltransferase n=1 Tax=Arion vulgaris TaxID=1028688 RepID=A0A0B6YU78_9EUPU